MNSVIKKLATQITEAICDLRMQLKHELLRNVNQDGERIRDLEHKLQELDHMRRTLENMP